MNSNQIENLLRQAPQPKAPERLKERLKARVPVQEFHSPTQILSGATGVRGWFARWWPALIPAGISLACAAVFSVQQSEIRDLKQALLPQAGTPAVPDGEVVDSLNGDGRNAAATAASAGDQAEVTRLKAVVAGLLKEVSQLEQMSVENERLRRQLATSGASYLTPEETGALEAARDKAMAIACINNLKQLGLAARIWANDHGEATPPQLLAMTNEMSTPRILVCPADTGRQAAGDWASFTSANCSYEYLAPSVSTEKEPDRVLFRCPVHGSLCLLDGSAQLRAAKDHPDALVNKGGILYYQPGSAMEITPTRPPPVFERRIIDVKPGDSVEVTPTQPPVGADPDQNR